jgi:DNA-binding transcriptional ArsR family regulator
MNHMDSFAALADPTRRRIFELIAEGEKSVGEIVSQFPYKAPTISQHLQVLRDARLVRVRAEGQKRIYTMDQEGFRELEAWVGRQRDLWSQRLDALERHLDVRASTENHPHKETAR